MQCSFLRMSFKCTNRIMYSNKANSWRERFPRAWPMLTCVSITRSTEFARYIYSTLCILKQKMNIAKSFQRNELKQSAMNSTLCENRFVGKLLETWVFICFVYISERLNSFLFNFTSCTLPLLTNYLWTHQLSSTEMRNISLWGYSSCICVWLDETIKKTTWFEWHSFLDVLTKRSLFKNGLDTQTKDWGQSIEKAS